MFAEVAFPISNFKTFTYQIPEKLIAQTHVGSRVIAPFRRQQKEGIIVNIFASSNFKGETKLINKIDRKLKFPVVIKPINEGSSVNVFICRKSNIYKRLNLLKEYKKIIIEKYIPGREIQAAIIGSNKLGAIELKPKRKFYDYQAKYNPKAKTKHMIPVDLTKNKYNQLMNIALKAHKILNCSGVTRSDFKFFKNKFYLLEVNTQPGMTKLSLVPEIASFKKISFIKLIELILKNAIKVK